MNWAVAHPASRREPEGVIQNGSFYRKEGRARKLLATKGIVPEKIAFPSWGKSRGSRPCR